MIDNRVHRPSPFRSEAPERPETRLARLEERYRHELMNEGERCELRDRIARLKRKAGRP